MTGKKLENLRILSIDDDVFMLEFITTILNQLGVNQVETLDNATRALAFIKEHGEAIDVILCDLLMTEMDGIEFMDALNQNGIRRSRRNPQRC
jgi:CheY-like chemotaxis protein